MPNTVPNQRLVAIHRERASSDFLGIKNSHWQAAARDLGAHALMLYLYFASNANGFMLALSPAAIRQAVGMPSSTYRDQFVRLVDKGYLVQRGGSNTYDFYETPQRATHTEKDETDGGYDFTADAFGAPQTVNNDTPPSFGIPTPSLRDSAWGQGWFWMWWGTTRDSTPLRSLRTLAVDIKMTGSHVRLPVYLSIIDLIQHLLNGVFDGILYVCFCISITFD